MALTPTERRAQFNQPIHPNISKCLPLPFQPFQQRGRFVSRRRHERKRDARETIGPLADAHGIANRAAMKALQSAFSDTVKADQENTEIEELDVEF